MKTPMTPLEAKKRLKKKLTPTNKQIDKIINDMTCRKCGYMVYMSVSDEHQQLCNHEFPLMDIPKPSIALFLKSKTKDGEKFK